MKIVFDRSSSCDLIAKHKVLKLICQLLSDPLPCIGLTELLKTAAAELSGDIFDRASYSLQPCINLH